MQVFVADLHAVMTSAGMRFLLLSLLGVGLVAATVPVDPEEPPKCPVPDHAPAKDDDGAEGPACVPAIEYESTDGDGQTEPDNVNDDSGMWFYTNSDLKS